MTDFKNNITRLLDSSGNLHSDVIKNYVHNALSSADTHAVERHLLNSPFDLEVVEGYQAMRKNKNADYYVDQIKSGLPSIVGPEKVMQINYKLIAASVVGILGLVSIGYLVSNLDFNSKSELAVIKEEVKEVEEKTTIVAPIRTEITDSMVVITATEMNVPLQKEEMEFSRLDQNIPEETELVNSESVVLAESTPVVEEELEEEDSEMADLNELVSKKYEEPAEEVVVVDPSPEMLSYSKNTVESPKVSKKHASKAEKIGFTEATELRGEKSLLDEAGVRFRKNEYSDAAKFYDLVLNSNPSQQDALKFGGLSNLYIGNYSKAANQLSQVSNKTDSDKWSLATAYRISGRKESASGILKDLEVNGSSNFKSKAKDILATF